MKEKYKASISDLHTFSRRDFFRLSATAGFTVATVVAGVGLLGHREAEAQVRNEEKERQAAAKYTMNVGTAYRFGTNRSFPVMQLQLKENIQNATRGKVYVKLVPNGSLGAGAELAQKVQAGTIQAAQHSLANFAPFAPAIDLINIPYWCGENQQFVNLVTSDIWKQEIDTRIEANGFKVLVYQCVDPRTASMRRGLRDEPFRIPEDLEGIKFRIPGSKILGQFYRLLGANPTPVAWGETPSALQQGVADALDPNVMGLNLYGFKNLVSHVTFNRAVPDGGAYSCNLEWFNSLDPKTREGVEWGAQITFLQDLSQVPASREYSMAEMSDAGVQFYSLTDDEKAQWKERAGEQRPEWKSTKQELAGSAKTFDRLKEAAQTQSRYYVHDA